MNPNSDYTLENLHLQLDVDSNNNNSYDIDIENPAVELATGCPKKNYPVAFLLISPIKLHLLGFSRTVLKSAGSQDSKTVPESSN